LELLVFFYIFKKKKGGGLMGSGIAVSSLLSGYNVLIKEIDNDSLNFSLNRILGFLFFLTIKINIKGI
jgi:hypothetical protein